ncbi:hypothetical protein COL154_013999, partial [Colletotrichum chrysophilum]
MDRPPAPSVVPEPSQTERSVESAVHQPVRAIVETVARPADEQRPGRQSWYPREWLEGTHDDAIDSDGEDAPPTASARDNRVRLARAAPLRRGRVLNDDEAEDRAPKRARSVVSASTIDIRRTFGGSLDPPSESYSTTSQAQCGRWRSREALPYARLAIRDERRPVDNIEEDKKRIKPYEGMMSQLMPAAVDFRRYPETRLMSSEFDWQRLRKLVEAFGGYEDGKTILQVTLHSEDRVMGAGRLSHEGEFHQAIAKMIDIAGWDDQNTAHAPEIAVTWVLRDGDGERDLYDPFQQVLDPPPRNGGEEEGIQQDSAAAAA